MRAHPCLHLKTHKNVLFLITGLGHGGAETQVVRVACELKKRGWVVNIVTLLTPVAKPLIGQLEEHGVPLTSLDLGENSKLQDLRLMSRLLRILEKEKPYVLCSFLFHANIVGQVASKLAGVPRFITSIRGASFGSDKRVKFAKFFHHFDDITTLNSNEVAEKMIADGVLSRDKTRILNNAISVEKFDRSPDFRKELRAKMHIDPATFVFIALGRVHPVKGYNYLVQACEKLSGDFKLFIVGKDDNDELKTSIKNSKLEDKVVLLGYRTDVPDLLSMADALVLSSISEGLPNALIEAHAARLPIITTRVGGASEIVLENKSGFIVTAKKPRQLAGAMNEMKALSKEAREEMGLLGREHVSEKFGLKSIVDRWESVLISPP